MAVTKKRDGEGWRIHINGKPTTLLALKGDPPKWGDVQRWDLVDEADDTFLFDAKGLGSLVGILEHLGGVFGR